MVGGQCTGPSQLGPWVMVVEGAGGKGDSPVSPASGVRRSSSLSRLSYQASSLWRGRVTVNKLQSQGTVSPPPSPPLPRETKGPPARLGLGLVKPV